VGKKTGKNPTDRGKLGVKRSTLIDGRGVPLAVAVDGANVPDQKLVAQTLDAIPIPRPEAAPRKPQHLCLDKGYAGEPVDREVRRRGYTPHVPRKANEPSKPKHRTGKARRWKVERTHSWLNRARRLLIRWEKKAANYIGFLHLQFAIIALRTAGVIG
jgi:putative transposase